MRIGVAGHSAIVIPDELAVVQPGPFDGHTSYISKLVERLGRPGYVNDKLPRKLRCVQSARHRAEELGGYRSVCEPMAGVGLTARMLAAGGEILLNDVDEGCRKVLAANFVRPPTGYDALTADLDEADFVFLDFNDFTLKRFVEGPHGAALARGFGAARKFLLVNDCSVFYFRYGEHSYEVYSELLGCPISTVPDYLAALREFYASRFPDWHMVNAAYFRDSSFQLFAREDASLVVEEAQPTVRVQYDDGHGLFF